jgi:hypothetical protein
MTTVTLILYVVPGVSPANTYDGVAVGLLMVVVATRVLVNASSISIIYVAVMPSKLVKPTVAEVEVNDVTLITDGQGRIPVIILD